jgi:hypothetical protein
MLETLKKLEPDFYPLPVDQQAAGSGSTGRLTCRVSSDQSLLKNGADRTC